MGGPVYEKATVSEPSVVASAGSVLLPSGHAQRHSRRLNLDMRPNCEKQRMKLQASRILCITNVRVAKGSARCYLI